MSPCRAVIAIMQYFNRINPEVGGSTNLLL